MRWIATPFGFGDENSCGNHEFSCPLNSDFSLLLEIIITRRNLLGNGT